MRKLEFIDNEFLDDAIERLLKEKEKGNHVYLEFLGHKLYSDTVTYDSAYLEVCHCTKAEYEQREAERHEAYLKQREKEMVEESFQVNRKNAIIGVIFSKLLFLTKNGEVISYQAEDYVDTFKKYTPYIKEDERLNWINEIRRKVYSAGKGTTYEQLDLELRSYEIAGMIMEHMAQGVSWDELKEYTQIMLIGQEDFLLVRDIMKRYSLCAEEFDQNVIRGLHKDDPYRFKLRVPKNREQ